MVIPHGNPAPGAHIGPPGLPNGPDLADNPYSADEWEQDRWQTVYAGEAECPGRRSYPVIETLAHSAPRHDAEPQRARTVGARVDRLEVDRREPIVPRPT